MRLARICYGSGQAASGRVHSERKITYANPAFAKLMEPHSTVTGVLSV